MLSAGKMTIAQMTKTKKSRSCVCRAGISGTASGSKRIQTRTRISRSSGAHTRWSWNMHSANEQSIRVYSMMDPHRPIKQANKILDNIDELLKVDDDMSAVANAGIPSIAIDMASAVPEEDLHAFFKAYTKRTIPNWILQERPTLWRNSSNLISDDFPSPRASLTM